MAELTAIRSRLSETDRLGVTAFGSLLAHMVIILGVTFAIPKLDFAGLQNLEITLVQASSTQAPDNPDFLAQANQDGGGTSERPDVAKNPLPLKEISDSLMFPTQRPTPRPPVIAKRDTRELLTQSKAEKSIATTEPEPQRKPERFDPAQFGLPAIADTNAERARLSAALDRGWQEYQERPRRKFLTSRATAYRDAIYVEGFRTKVERVGNLNYPAEAKRRSLRGRLVMHVIIRHDGTYVDSYLTRSSGHKIIDEAAKNIAKLAAPYAPFPPELRAEADEVVMTNTWLFNDSFSQE